MRTIILSVAHAPQSQGATFGGLSEYGISLPLSTRVAALLEYGGNRVEFFDMGGKHPEWSYTGKVLHNKAQQVNSIAYAMKRQGCESLAVELHLNSVTTKPGTSVLYASGSSAGAACARVVQDTLVEGLERGVHWYGPNNGLIETPGPYYGPDKRVTFLHKTEPPAIIVELDSMVNAAWFADNIDDAALCVAVALQRAAEV